MEESRPLLGESLGDDAEGLWYGPFDTAVASPSPPGLVVYFIPGNPCLMSYYKLFLSHLSSLLNSGLEGSEQQTIVGGYTLPGFQISNPTTIKGTLPAGLDDEILNAEDLLARAVARSGFRNGDGGAVRGPKVILVAHSVGAYMVLEILRRKAQHLNELADLDIIGAILLFPTVTEIAKSWHGSILSVSTIFPSLSMLKT